MANARSTKRDIDRAKKDKAALKRQRREHADDASGESTAAPVSFVRPSSERELLDALELLHGRFDAGQVGFDEFEAVKLDLLNQLAGR